MAGFHRMALLAGCGMLLGLPAEVASSTTSTTAETLALVATARASSCFLAPLRPPAGRLDIATVAAARQGEAAAMLGVAEAFLAEPGPAAAHNSVVWLERAATAGATRAAGDAGRAYWAGHGVSVDPARAMAWWRYGATRGDTRSMACLSAAYLIGEAGTADPVDAAQWSLRRDAVNRGASLLRPAARDFERALPASAMLEARRIAAEPAPQAMLPPAEPPRASDAPPPVAAPLPAALPNAATSQVAAGIWPSAMPMAMTPPRPIATPPAGSRTFAGTGVVVAAPGVVLTAAHAVKDCAAGLEVHQGLAQLGQPELRASHERLDLALLVVPGLDRPALPVGGSVRLGAEVMALGYPNQGLRSLRPTVTLGNVSVLGERTMVDFLQFTAPIQPGNSGGPLIDRQGRIIGVAIRRQVPPADAANGVNLPQNINYAVGGAVVERFLLDHGVWPAEASQPEGGFVGLVEAVERSIVRVVCHRQRRPEAEERSAAQLRVTRGFTVAGGTLPTAP